MSVRSLDIKKPRTDDHQLWDVTFYLTMGFAVLAAHEMKLFRLLAEKPRSLSEVCDALGIHMRPAEVLLSICTVMGLAELNNGKYNLTPVSEDYLLEESPTYFGDFLNLKIANPSVYSYEKIKQAVLADSPQVYGEGVDLFKAHDEKDTLAAKFTRAMHSTSMGPALAWPELIDLSKNHIFLDVGGGSGAHTIGALRRWPNLRGVIFERPNVCSVSKEYVTQYGLDERIKTACADMWSDPYPAADLHFYSMIYHDWPADKCAFLTRKSFESLEPGGMILIHEMLYNDEKTGPFPAAAFSLEMLLWTTGRQYSGPELSDMLMKAGFRDINITPTFGYWSLVSGRKPG